MAILGTVVSLLYVFIYLATGQLLSRVLFSTERMIIRIWLGGVLSLVLLLWLPALCAFFFTFNLLSQLLALAFTAWLGQFCFLYAKKKAIPPDVNSLKNECAPLLTVFPFLLLGIYLFLTHTLNPVGGALHSGQSTFGDLPLHLGLVSSIGEQGMFPPMYSIFPGAQVGYPFLCDSISATFYVLGGSLRFSMLLPAIFAYALVLFGVYFFFECWLASHRTAILATLLFLIGGGFGFAYFLDLWQEYPGNFMRIFEAFYQTPTNNVEVGIKWVNPIADMLIPQRATLFGWALLFPALFMLRRAAFSSSSEESPPWFVYLGILAGCMPLVHTHSFLALGILSAVYLLRALLMQSSGRALRGWLCYALLAIGLAAPQLLIFTFRQSGDFLHFQFNWANETDSFLWFYIKNLGLLFLLLPIAFVRLEKKERWFYAGAIAIWVLSELVQFQPNPYDNNKLLFVWFAYTCGIIAKLLLDAHAALANFKGRRYISICTLLLLFLSGMLTLGRECISDFEQFGADEVQAAAYIKEHTQPDALFLTASNHNNAVSSLSGRNILCGTGSYLYFHGLDYAQREAHLRLMYEEPETYFMQLSMHYGVDYVLIGNSERYGYACDMAYFSQFPLAYENDTVQIYDVGAISS